MEVETRYINNKSKNNTQSNNGSKESINIKNKIETIQNYLEKQQVSIYDINELKSYILEQLFKNKDISKKLYYILNLLFSYK
ncbi:MAG: hypothetical protein P1U46_02635 [Patescibacteria group bacterium]|nr:hypothetical protein [Patescibacteria group bacterium]